MIQSKAWPLFLFLAFSPALAAQENPRQLLRLVPDDFGLVFAAHDLRDQFTRWEKSPWLKKIHESPLFREFLGSAEMKDLLKLKADLKRHLEVDWTAVRDDLLGDAALFGFRPGPGHKEPEDWLFLVQARDGELLGKLLDRVNELQKKNSELKELTTLEHAGVKYVRRVHQRTTQFYFLKGSLLAVAGQEATLKALIDRSAAAKTNNYWERSFERAAVPRSFASLLVNPRAFDAELRTAGKKEADPFKEQFGRYWAALEAVAFNLRWDESLELRLSLLGNEKDVSPAAKHLFAPIQTSPLWSHFPQKAIVTLAGEWDFSLAKEPWDDLLPAEARKLYLDLVQKTVGAALGLDAEKDLLPNLGPHWGLSVFGSETEKHLPQGVFALAVRPGAGKVKADEALLKGLDALAIIAQFKYNSENKDQIRINTLMQDKVQVRTLVNDAFPPGFQPSFALKDGYLLLATSPEGIARFRTDVKPAAVGDEVPILRLSATELSRELKTHRDFLINHVSKSSGIEADAARQMLEGGIGVLGLFDRVELAHTSAKGQRTLILRVSP